ncbi:MAG: DUF6776 family protein, partial [Gammaproteobacteria bacterium]
LAAWALFEYGRYRAGYDTLNVQKEFMQLESTIYSFEEQIELLREENAVMERAAQVERQAYDEVNTTLKALQAEILELNGELAFYRGIISPRSASQGLHLQSYKLIPNGELRGYRYEISLTQVLKHSRLAQGNIRLNIEGIENGHQKMLRLNQLTENHVKELKFKFKYFQNFKGNITLPENFLAKRVSLQVLPRGREKDMIEKIFDWPFKE